MAAGGSPSTEPKLPCPSISGRRMREILRHAHQRVVDRLVAVRVVFTHHVADDARRLHVGLVPARSRSRASNRGCADAPASARRARRAARGSRSRSWRNRDSERFISSVIETGRMSEGPADSSPGWRIVGVGQWDAFANLVQISYSRFGAATPIRNGLLQALFSPYIFSDVTACSARAGRRPAAMPPRCARQSRAD